MEPRGPLFGWGWGRNQGATETGVDGLTCRATGPVLNPWYDSWWTSPTDVQRLQSSVTHSPHNSRHRSTVGGGDPVSNPPLQCRSWSVRKTPVTDTSTSRRCHRVTLLWGVVPTPGGSRSDLLWGQKGCQRGDRTLTGVVSGGNRLSPDTSTGPRWAVNLELGESRSSSRPKVTEGSSWAIYPPSPPLQRLGDGDTFSPSLVAPPSSPLLPSQ